jgi:hypothetical protein
MCQITNFNFSSYCSRIIPIFLNTLATILGSVEVALVTAAGNRDYKDMKMQVGP